MVKYILKNRCMVIAFAIVSIISCFVSIKFALSFEPIINSVSDRNMNMLINSSVWCFMYAVLDCVLLLIVEYLKNNIIKKCCIDLKSQCFSNIINKDVKDFNSKNSGSYISILNNDIEILKRKYFENYLQLYTVCVCFIFSLVTVWYLNWTITIILIIIALCSILIPKCLDSKLSRLQKEYSSSVEKYFSHIKDFFAGFEIIKSFNIQSKVIMSHDKDNKYIEDKNCETNMNIYFAGWISMIFTSIMYAATFSVGGYFVIKGLISLGLLVSLSQLIGGVVAPIERIPSMFASINSTSEIKEKVEKILCKNNKSKIEAVNAYKRLNRISFENVSFSYEDSDKKALDNVNIEFEKKKKYAIVGESGSGKSTIIKLILDFYKADNGRVLFDNMDDGKECYSVNCIHQNTFIFDDTLKNNITLFKEFSDEEIENVVRKAGLTSLLSNLPKGINTRIGEGNYLLSGGERQRIGIARTLIRKSDFLILDEAMSSLDTITSKHIFDNIFDIDDAGIIMITHQLNYNMLDKCDCIYVVRNGSVVEQGTIRELLDKKDYFYSLYYINNL